MTKKKKPTPLEAAAIRVLNVRAASVTVGLMPISVGADAFQRLAEALGPLAPEPAEPPAPPLSEENPTAYTVWLSSGSDKTFAEWALDPVRQPFPGRWGGPDPADLTG